ncbi:MAG: Tat pathway signal protein, partial [Verrucomicrobia bacterium]|nr:Tat pathway signal protein [Verrucomicrobiota bacterium]
EEAAIRRLAEMIFARVDWNWMANGDASLTMGWAPESGFLASRWVGYNEGMILYLLGLGARTNPLPAAAWGAWTKGYQWQTNYGYSYVGFEPLFGHQYSHCWIDFRGLADQYMRGKGITYFENSRRATLAQRGYAVVDAPPRYGYGSNVWGLTACDGPGRNGFFGYAARGAPPPMNDDGTIAPTAAGGSLPFAPEICLPALRHLYERYRTNLWCAYGFRDAFNLQAGWWDPDVLGIDQGPIAVMVENYRNQRVWRRFMANPEIQRGLRAAGFRPLSGARP